MSSDQQLAATTRRPAAVPKAVVIAGLAVASWVVVGIIVLAVIWLSRSLFG